MTPLTSLTPLFSPSSDGTVNFRKNQGNNSLGNVKEQRRRELFLQVGRGANNPWKNFLLGNPQKKKPRNNGCTVDKHSKDTKTRKWNATRISLATWNVRTMLRAGKMAEVADEVLKYGMDVVALQEMRWCGNGRIDKKKYSVFYSGPDTRTGQYGTGFIINSKMKQSYLGFEPIGDRMCKLKLKGRFRNVSIISAYAPTEEATDEEKITFYDKLDRECSKIPRYDVLILLGDFNTKIDREELILIT